MSWSAEDCSNEGSSSSKDEKQPKIDKPDKPVKKKKTSERKDDIDTVAPPPPVVMVGDPIETDKDIKTRCVKFVARNSKKGKSPEEIHTRLVKKFGMVLTLEEVEYICHAQQAKTAAETTVAPSETTPVVAEVFTAMKRHRICDEKVVEENQSPKKKKHIGRPPDEGKQRTIIEAVEQNPSISLRSVASSLDCSKSQVARVLALNGFQRNKGRVGEWQRVPTSRTDSSPEKESEASQVQPQTAEPKPQEKEKNKKVKEHAEKKDKSTVDKNEPTEEQQKQHEEQQKEERPHKKKRTRD